MSCFREARRHAGVWALAWAISLILSESAIVHASDSVAQSFPPAVQGTVTGVAVDSQQNRYVCGYFAGTLDFNPGIGEDSKTSQNGFTAFVTRIDRDGTYNWTQTFGGTGGNDRATCVTLANNGTSVCVAGQFNSTNAGFGGLGTFASSGGLDAFVIELNPATGAPVTAFGNSGFQKFGGTGDDAATCIADNAGMLVVAGTFNSTNAGIGGTGSLATSGGIDTFIMALDDKMGTAFQNFATGGLQKFGGTGNDNARGVCFANGNIYVVGDFNAVAGIGGASSINPYGSVDAFVCALDKTGVALSTFNSSGQVGLLHFGGGGSDSAAAVCSSGSSIYVAGQIRGNGAILSNDINGTAHNALGGSDAFVFAVNSSSASILTSFGNTGVQLLGGTARRFRHVRFYIERHSVYRGLLFEHQLWDRRRGHDLNDWRDARRISGGDQYRIRHGAGRFRDQQYCALRRNRQRRCRGGDGVQRDNLSRGHVQQPGRHGRNRRFDFRSGIRKFPAAVEPE